MGGGGGNTNKWAKVEFCAGKTLILSERDIHGPFRKASRLSAGNDGQFFQGSPKRKMIPSRYGCVSKWSVFISVSLKQKEKTTLKRKPSKHTHTHIQRALLSFPWYTHPAKNLTETGGMVLRGSCVWVNTCG